MSSSDDRSAGRRHFHHVRGRHGARWDDLEPYWQSVYTRNAGWCHVCRMLEAGFVVDDVAELFPHL